MRRSIIIGVALLALLSPAQAADSNLPPMTAAGALADTDLMYCGQSTGTLDRKCTPLQMAAYIFGKMSADATASGTGAITLATVNANVGTFGSATACITTTQNAKGLTTAISAATCTPAIGSITGLGTGVATAAAVNVGTAGSVVVNGGALGTPSSGVGTNLTGTAAGLTAGNVTTNANLTGAVSSTGNATLLGSFSSANLLAALTTKTGTGNAVFGTAPTIDSLNATTAVTLAFITGSTQCLQVNTSGVISGTGAVCGGSGSSGANPTATAGDVAVNGVSTSFLRADGAPAIQKASSSLFGIAKVDGTTITATAGVITAVPGVTSRSVTGATDTILAADRGNVVYYNSASSIAVSQPAPSGSFAANFFTTVCNINTGIPTITPGSGTIGGGATYALLAGTTASPYCVSYQSDGTNFNFVGLDASLGSNVGVALGKTLSAAGGLTSTIASGTSAMGTGAITSATCATVVTTAATNTATTDVVSWGFNGDPTAVTGYVPLVAGMLTIIAYPTSGNVNFKVCNNTSGSVTPGAITLNWRVVR